MNEEYQESPTSSRLNNSSLIEANDHHHHHKVDNLDYSCGIWNFRPKWLQKLARKQIFLLVFCLTSVFQGMYFTYIVSMITTIEKLYQLPSRTTGFIISSVELGQISGSLTLAYFGGKSHRPRWIGLGILLFAFANILCSSPHFLLPSELERRSTVSLAERTSFNLSDGREDQRAKDEFLVKEKLCLIKNQNKFNFFGFGSSSQDQSSRIDKCKENNEQTNKKNKVTSLATYIFLTAAILVGFGTTAVNTLGIPYIDDNVAAKESPLYFAITIGVKIFGPVLGFLLGSLCTSIYINFPFDNGHGLTPAHPEWIGAWWLGVFMLGTIIVFNSIFMMSFPKKLPSKRHLVYDSQCEEERAKFEEKTYKAKQLKTTDQKESYSKLHVENVSISNNNDEEMNCCNFNRPITKDDDEPLKKEVLEEDERKDAAKILTDKNDKKPNDKNSTSFFNTIKRLLKNRILLCRIASTVFHILPVSGLYTFLPKYLEYQYRITASDASFISGIAGIMVMGLGIFSSGAYMRKMNPNPKTVSRWISIATFFYVCGMIVLMFLGCPLPKISGLNGKNLDLDCPDCQCESGQFMPICASNSITYMSPCLAGCTRFNKTGNDYNYLDCKCLPNNVKIVKNGFCDSECNNLMWYIILFSVIALLHSTTEVGAMLLTLRSVDPNDKTVALGLVAFISSLFGSFPCLIIYGTVIDTACIFWQKDCDTNGACRLFDSDLFRVYFHALTAFFMFLAFLFDICVWMMSSRIDFQDEELPKHQEDDKLKSELIKNDLMKDNDTNNNSNSNSLIKPEDGHDNKMQSLEDGNNNKFVD